MRFAKSSVMAKRNNDFDEGAFLAAMSEGHRFGAGGAESSGSVAPTPAPPPVPITPAPQPIDVPAEPAPPPVPITPAPQPAKHSEPRTIKRVGDYEATFLQPRTPIEKRSFIGVPPELHALLSTIVRRIGDGVSVQAFTENVLRHHLAEYQSEINRLNREKLKKDIL